MKSTLKIAAVSYLNTIPFLYGLIHHPISTQLEIIKDTPSAIFKLFKKNEVDIALMPVGALPKLHDFTIFSSFCIGCNGAVATVQLFSNDKIDTITTVFLDYQSMTSVNLCRIVFKEIFKRDDVTFLPTKPGYERQLESNEAALIIGDRATYALKYYKYSYDLGELWFNKFQLPFVFAVWISATPLADDLINKFDEAFAAGMLERDKIVTQFSFFNNTKFNVHDYLFTKLQYKLDNQKRLGMQLFLEKMNELAPLQSQTTLTNKPLHSTVDKWEL